MKPIIGRALKALREQIDPYHVQRAQAKNLQVQSTNLRINASSTLLEGYEEYLAGNYDEALEQFVSAPRR